MNLSYTAHLSLYRSYFAPSGLSLVWPPHSLRRTQPTMSVIPLTLTISLCLVFTFVVFFLRETSKRHYSDAQRDALMPLADETPIAATASALAVAQSRSGQEMHSNANTVH